MSIDPRAVVDAKAELDSSVIVGPYAVIGPGVKIGAHSEIKAHAVVTGPTTLGEKNTISSFAVVGADPQDLTYGGEPTELIVGSGNRIREFASIHRGTVKGGGRTIIGDDNLLMSYIHVAHDCILGNNIIMSNVATLAGHIEVGDNATIGGLVAIHQFCRVGTFSYIGGVSGLTQDVPPYVILAGTRNRTRISGINKIGLRRHGFSKDTIKTLDKAYRLIFRSSNLLTKDAIEQAEKEYADCAEVKVLVQFFKDSTRGVVKQAGDE